MYANLFGDHIKGSDLHAFSPIVQAGINLHRSIDSYIDHHPDVITLMHKLYPELPKVTGIAIDLFFDHLLAKNWNNYHSVPLNEFLDNFYLTDPINWENYTTGFRMMIQQMREKRWLNYYHEMYGLRKACEGVSARLSFENELKNAPEVFIKHQSEIQICFEKFMKEAIPFFNQKIKDLDF